MTDRERISWIELIINVVIGGWYFSRILAMPADADLFGPRTAAFAISLVVVAVVASIACEILLRMVQKRTGGGTDAALHDERDALINLRAARNAHGVLAFSVILVVAQIALIEWAQRYRGRHPDPETILGVLATGPLTAPHIAQLLLAALTLGAITLSASRIFYYRRGY